MQEEEEEGLPKFKENFLLTADGIFNLRGK